MNELQTFDPLSQLLLAQSARPQHWGRVNFRALSPFQRALLVIDGTVTNFIEAYTMEPMQIVCLAQGRRPLGEDQPWLDATRETPVTVRQVLIRGEYSQTFRVYAVSFVVHDRLPEQLGARLKGEGDGIGRVFNDAELETRRQILWYGRERMEKLPRELQGLTDGDFITRTYRILHHGRAIALINERFPSEKDRLPSHH